MNTDELVQFWSRLGAADTVHPDDVAHLVGREEFALDLIPQPWAGPILMADVFLLYLNPGLSGPEVHYERDHAGFREALRATLLGREPYLYLDPRFADHPGYGWSRSKLGAADLPPGAAKRICMVELVAYHSTKGSTVSSLSRSLPSSRAVQAWAKATLLKRAMEGEITLVVVRGRRPWGFSEDDERENVVVYKGVEPQGGWLTPRTRGGAAMRRQLGR